MDYSFQKGNAMVIVVLLVVVGLGAGAYFYFSGATGEDLLPGEPAFLQEVEAAEALIGTIAGDPTPEQCETLRDHFADGVKGFEQMMPHLEGFALRSRDSRLGEIREFFEKRC